MIQFPSTQGPREENQNPGDSGRFLDGGKKTGSNPDLPTVGEPVEVPSGFKEIVTETVLELRQTSGTNLSMVNPNEDVAILSIWGRIAEPIRNLFTKDTEAPAVGERRDVIKRSIRTAFAAILASGGIR